MSNYLERKLTADGAIDRVNFLATYHKLESFLIRVMLTPPTWVGVKVVQKCDGG